MEDFDAEAWAREYLYPTWEPECAEAQVPALTAFALRAYNAGRASRDAEVKRSYEYILRHRERLPRDGACRECFPEDARWSGFVCVPCTVARTLAPPTEEAPTEEEPTYYACPECFRVFQFALNEQGAHDARTVIAFPQWCEVRYCREHMEEPE